tara:strand:+ start:1623 stop:2936 length:1314 start_codon:yes stop_codon:yes gene_type:complete
MEAVAGFPRYDQYKGSGVEWIGEIPRDWKVESIRAVTELKSEKNRPELPVLSVYREYGVIPKDSRDDNHNATSLDTSGYKVVNTGDLVVNKMKAWQGSMGVSEHAGIVSPAYITCRVDHEIVAPKYLHYLLRSKIYIGVYNALSYGVRVGQWDMHYEDFKGIPIPLPDLDTQQRIANFLDQKTAEIDAAIAKKQRLIELLKEQKAILINQAVTQGLDPNVPMRHSGVAWIGQVPEHWSMPPMYSRFRIELGKMLDSSRITGKHLVPYLRNTDVQWGSINTDSLPEMDIAPSEINRYSVKNGDLLVCEGGEIGRCAIWSSSQANESVGFQKALHRVRSFRPSEENIRYLYYVMMAAGHVGAFHLTAKTSTISHLTGEMFRVYRFPQPPRKEQDAIVSYLDGKTNQIDLLIQKEEAVINLLYEFKSTYISEAVTGKIKL